MPRNGIIFSWNQPDYNKVYKSWISHQPHPRTKLSTLFKYGVSDVFLMFSWIEQVKSNFMSFYWIALRGNLEYGAYSSACFLNLLNLMQYWKIVVSTISIVLSPPNIPNKLRFAQSAFTLTSSLSEAKFFNKKWGSQTKID